MASHACLSDDDRDLGTLLIDFGGGTTSVAIFSDGQLCLAGTIRMGGINVTRDIAKMLSISVSEAERLKAIDGSVLPIMGNLNHGKANNFQARVIILCCQHTLYRGQADSARGQMFQRQFLNDIIRTRCEEILESIEQLVQTSGLGPARSYNLALTGGASQLKACQILFLSFGKSLLPLDNLTRSPGLMDKFPAGPSPPVWALPVLFNLLKTR